MLVYDAGPAIGDERPEAFAFVAHEFFERRDLFLVSRETGLVFPQLSRDLIRAPTWLLQPGWPGQSQVKARP
jgi:hypothetical protein